MTTVVIVSRDRQLDEFVRASSFRSVLVPSSDLSSLGKTLETSDCLVLDTRSGVGIPADLATVTRNNPGLGVVIVASTLDPALLLEAMRAGVKELVADPITQADLERAIKRVISQRKSVEFGQVFAFVGAKGGVGTTTVAVNVAIALASLKDSRTLLIDMQQAGGDAAVFMGVDPRFSVADAIENIQRLDESYLQGLVTKAAPGLDLLASSDRHSTAAVESAGFKHVLEFVTTAYKYVVLDLRRADMAVLDALDRVTSIFIVANQELATVKSGSRIANTLRQRYGRDKIQIVLSRSDRQADIGVADVERTMGAEVIHTFPSDYRVALKALNTGRPLALQRDTDLADSFYDFVDRLVSGKREQTSRARAPRTGLLGRLSPLRAS